MPKRLLSNRAVKTAKPRAQPCEVDAGNGLLLQTQDDRNVWIVRYKFAGSNRAYTIGDYLKTSLSEARADAAAVCKLAALGVNPSTCTFETWDAVRTAIQQRGPQRST